jgi:(1->4)-alpha-D-glucan 1-alpha-D-glucosylmutase
VDYAARQAMLNELKAGLSAEEIMKRADSGMPKLWVVNRALSLRQQMPGSFTSSAAYTPLVAKGPKSDHVVAYLRGSSVVTCVPRFSAHRGDRWGATSIELPPGQWKNELTGEQLNGGPVRLQALLGQFPVALLAQWAE